jgi:ferredoxin
LSAEIYYFSGSGNSLVVAREIAERIGARRIGIPSVPAKGRIRPRADVIGLVFPVHYAWVGGVPAIVRGFVERLDLDTSDYIFAVCTHDGAPVDTLETLAMLLEGKGAKLSLAADVQLAVPYEPRSKIAHALFGLDLKVDEARDQAKRKELARRWAGKLDHLVEQIEDRVAEGVVRRGALRKALTGPFLALQKAMAVSFYRRLAGCDGGGLEELIPQIDRSFRVLETCIGCETCSRVCPVGNIEMVGGRPSWQHHCETCYACVRWCPQGAIRGDLVEYVKGTHHPDVELAEMLAMNAGPVAKM